MKRSRKIGLGGALIVVGAWAGAPSLIERRMNKVTNRSIPVSDSTRAIHASLFVADLHADTTLWNRDLLSRGTREHVDVPRLVAGGKTNGLSVYPAQERFALLPLLLPTLLNTSLQNTN